MKNPHKKPATAPPKMMINFEKIERMTPSERHNIYKNAIRIGGRDAETVLGLLEQLALPYSDPACATLDDPLCLKIAEIVNSSAGVDAMREATDQGMPALAGVDPMVAAVLGADYGRHNMTTATAGSFVAERMRRLGYRDIGKKAKLPNGCVAKTGALFEKQ